jgi:hypothetical protein
VAASVLDSAAQRARGTAPTAALPSHARTTRPAPPRAPAPAARPSTPPPRRPPSAPCTTPTSRRRCSGWTSPGWRRSTAPARCARTRGGRPGLGRSGALGCGGWLGAPCAGFYLPDLDRAVAGSLLGACWFACCLKWKGWCQGRSSARPAEQPKTNGRQLAHAPGPPTHRMHAVPPTERPTIPAKRTQPPAT